MGVNKDLRRKLAGQIAAYNEHNQKCRAYLHEHDKEFARKTMRNVRAQIQALCERLGAPAPAACEACGNIHEGAMVRCGGDERA